MKLKRGDNVIVITGKDKGKKGKITRVFPGEEKIIIEGVNIRKRHQKPRQANQKGQIIEFAAPMPASNAMIADPKTEKPTRIGFRLEGGKKVRYAKKSGTAIA